MSPRLYMAPASPPVRSVLMCAKALELQLELKEISLLAKDHFTPEYLKMNPQHTIPTLVDDDGFVLWDSHAIMPYLVSKYGKDDSLYPKDLKKRAVIDQRLHFDSNVLFLSGAKIIRKIVYKRLKQIFEEDRKALFDTYDIVEKFFETNDWVAGNSFTIADISFVTSISSWSKMVPLDEIRHPKIAAWYKKMKGLPCYEANIVGLEAYGKFFQSQLGI